MSSQYLGLAGNEVLASSAPGRLWQLGQLPSSLSGFSSFVLVWEECKNVTNASLKWPSCQDSGLYSPLDFISPQAMWACTGPSSLPVEWGWQQLPPR